MRRRASVALTPAFRDPEVYRAAFMGHHVFTSSCLGIRHPLPGSRAAGRGRPPLLATARFLAQQKPGGTPFVIGEGGLLTALHQNGYAVVDHDPDYVVVGEGRTFNLELVEAAVNMVQAGAKLVATNLDPSCPKPGGLRPGCGAMVAMLEAATGVKAFSVGKPSPLMMRAARKELGLATDETAIIGDTMETDILGGVQLGFHTVLVLSGGTRPEDLGRYAYRPEVVVDSLAEFSELLEQDDWRPPWRSPNGRARRAAVTAPI